MDRVDYLKLAEQYANFLVAVGGVSITALTLVLSLSGKSKDKKDAMRPAERTARTFLVAALSVSTVCCFIGAQMMAETAAFNSYIQRTCPALLGDRPFLLASTNIFMAAVLVLFALMLLPMVSGEKQAGSAAAISVAVFILIIAGAIWWMARAASSRMPPPSGYGIIFRPIKVSVVWGILVTLFTFRWLIPISLLMKIGKHMPLSLSIESGKLRPRKKVPESFVQELSYFFHKLINFAWKLVYSERLRNEYLLIATFIPIIFFTVTSLIWFASTFGEGDKVHDSEIVFFTLAVTFSYISLIIASIKIMLDNRAETRKRRTANVSVESIIPPDASTSLTSTP